MVDIPKNRHPSLLTIALTLDISTTTVSNVYNKPWRVGERTRARVLAEAARVGYVGPDPAARQLRRGASDLIGLVFTDELSFAFRDQAATGFLAGLSAAVGRAGRNLVLLGAGAPDDDGSPDGIAMAPMDGAVVYSVADADPALERTLLRRLPVVVVDQPGPDPRWSWVGLDDRDAGRAVGRHLRALGHQHVAVVSARLSRERRNGLATPPVHIDYRVRSERLEGLAEGFGVEGTPLFPLYESFETTERSGAAAFDALWDMHHPPTAIFCLSDTLALGALARARERGVTVPGEVSIIGFDDIPGAAIAGLSTIQQPLEAKGRAAGERICALIDHRRKSDGPKAKARDSVTQLATTLQVRHSSGPAPS